MMDKKVISNEKRKKNKLDSTPCAKFKFLSTLNSKFFHYYTEIDNYSKNYHLFHLK